MTTITLQVTDEQARRLSEEAAQRQTSVEEFVLRRLFDAADESEPQSHLTDEAIERIFTKNEELYRRLAG